MRHFLAKAVLAIAPRLEISDAERQEILTAWQSLAAVVEIEEEWDCLIQNYIDLETALLQSALHSMILSDDSYDDMHAERLHFARRLSNLLHACRSYIDHTPHYLNKLAGDPAAATFHELRRRAHAEHFGYRFMDAMRNYAQHRGVPLHGSTFNASWTRNADGSKEMLRYAVTASVDLARIREDRRFNAKVSAECEHIDRLDVATLTREYIEALASIQSAMREALSERIAGWKACVRGAISRYAAANKGDVLALAIMTFSEENEAVERVHIFEDMLARLEWLAHRNRNLVNLRLRYVTNELAAPDTRRR